MLCNWAGSCNLAGKSGLSRSGLWVRRVGLALGVGVFNAVLGVAQPQLFAQASQTQPPAASAPAAQPFTAPTHPIQFQVFQASKRGADWLFRMHGAKGRFSPGLLVDVQQEIEQDNLIKQSIAAVALARASRTFNEPRLEARSLQTILTLMEETAPDPSEPGTRVTRAPSLFLNKLAGASALALAVYELPNPPKDQLENAEQLVDGLRKLIRADGLFQSDGWAPSPEDMDGPSSYPFMTICALVRSNQSLRESWKLETAQRAYAAYSRKWLEQKQLGSVGWLVRAGVELYGATKDKATADFVLGVCDGLSGLQYDKLDPRRPGYFGGFRNWNNAGQVQEQAPTSTSAAAVEALALGWRLAGETGDANRHAKLQENLERGLQFLATIQYGESNTKHFADWYAPKLLGGVRWGPQDGRLRLEATSHALLAWSIYLEQPIK